MPTLEENVNRVKAAKTAIGNAITAKGGTVGTNDGLEDFAADIATIPSGGAEFSNSPTTFNLVKNIRNLDLVIPDGVTAIEQGAFISGIGIKSVVLPNTITSIPKFCFQDCTGLTSIEIPNGVITLANQCFQRCKNLEEIKLPNTLTSIGQNALSGCSKLKNLTIPSSVTFFGGYACSSLSSLETLKFEATTPASLSVNTVFGSLPTTCIIYIPTGSLAAYTSAANYPDSNTYTYVEY